MIRTGRAERDPARAFDRYADIYVYGLATLSAELLLERDLPVDEDFHTIYRKMGANRGQNLHVGLVIQFERVSGTVACFTG